MTLLDISLYNSLVVATTHMFSEWYLFSLYHFLTNNEYIIIDEYYYVFVTDIGSVTLMIVLPNGISKLIFINTFYIPILKTNLISLNILYCKDALVKS